MLLAAAPIMRCTTTIVHVRVTLRSRWSDTPTAFHKFHFNMTLERKKQPPRASEAAFCMFLSKRERPTGVRKWLVAAIEGVVIIVMKHSSHNSLDLSWRCPGAKPILTIVVVPLQHQLPRTTGYASAAVR